MQDIRAVFLKVWVVTKKWVAESQKKGSAKLAKVAPISQNKHFFFHSIMTELLHHTHFIWLYLERTRWVHHKWFSKSSNGSEAIVHC